MVACEASGLTPQAYAELYAGRDEAANAVLDEAMAEAGARTAKTGAVEGVQGQWKNCGSVCRHVRYVTCVR